MKGARPAGSISAFPSLPGSAASSASPVCGGSFPELPVEALDAHFYNKDLSFKGCNTLCHNILYIKVPVFWIII